MLYDQAGNLGSMLVQLGNPPNVSEETFAVVYHQLQDTLNAYNHLYVHSFGDTADRPTTVEEFLNRGASLAPHLAPR